MKGRRRPALEFIKSFDFPVHYSTACSDPFEHTLICSCAVSLLPVRRSSVASVVAATMTATAVSALAVFVIVVVTVHVRVIAESACDECIDCCICIPADSTKKTDADLSECHLCTTADAAADQCIDTELHEETGERAVTTAVRIHDLCTNDFAVRYIVDLKLCGMSEVLENLSVFIGYCNSHDLFSFLSACKMRDTADPDVSAGDVQWLSVDETGGELASCVFIDLLHGRA